VILFFYGRDSYRRKQKVDEIILAYRLKHDGLGVFKIDLEDDVAAFEEVVEFLRNQSLFDPLKIAVIKNFSGADFKASKKTKELKDFVERERSSKNTVIFSSEKKPGAEFKFLLSDDIKDQEFAELDEEGTMKFIKNEALKRGFQLNDEQVFLLEESFGEDTWSLVTELDKLSLSGRNFLVEKHSQTPEYFQTLNIFKFGKSINHRLWALEILLSQLREDPGRVFNSLPYGRAPIDQKKWLEILADYDVAVKSGKFDYEEVLTDLAIS
jgi:DNA polymerase III delta subunit